MKKRLNGLIFIIYTLFLIGFTLAPVHAVNVTIGVPLRAQEHSQWCWAGTSKAVLDYYGTSVSQCAIANWAWSRSDCCGSTVFEWNNACNQSNAMFGTSGSLQAIMSNWGVNSTRVDGVLSWSTVLSEINAKRPFVMRFGWTGGGGHFLDGYGYDNVSSPGYINYMDPWPGNGYTKKLYSATVSSSNHAWTHTLKVTTNPVVTASAQVTSLYPVSNAKPGQTSTLWAYVKNTGSTALPSNAVVWYYVRGPGVDKWLGSVSAAGIGAGASQWRGYNWAIPASSTPGTYTYWAIVYLGNTTAISAWSSPQNFAVTGSFSAQVTSLWSVSNAKPGQTSTLWAYVKNTGSTALPSNAVVWYYVRGPGVDKWLGSVSAAGIGAGASQWRGYNWAIPASSTPGTYTYWAIVYLGNTTAISAWSSPQNFAVTGSSTAGFNSQFKGTAPNWLAISGIWSVVSSEYLYSPGRAPGLIKYFDEAVYNLSYTSLDYSARLWRNGDETSSNYISIRGSGPILANGMMSNEYRFQYTRSGQFSVWKQVGGSYSALKDFTASSAIVKGSAWNTLRVRAIGSSLSFYINGTLVWSGSDASLSYGKVGVGMFRDTTSTVNGFWVDWAILTIPSAQADEDEISPDDAVVQEAFGNEGSLDGDMGAIAR